MDSFPLELKKTMDEQRLSQTDVAKKIGVDQKTISNWLRGKGIPKNDKIESIKKTLGIADMETPIFAEKDDIQKIIAIRNEIQKVFDTIGNSLSEIDKILNDKKF